MTKFLVVERDYFTDTAGVDSDEALAYVEGWMVRADSGDEAIVRVFRNPDHGVAFRLEDAR